MYCCALECLGIGIRHQERINYIRQFLVTNAILLQLSNFKYLKVIGKGLYSASRIKKIAQE